VSWPEEHKRETRDRIVEAAAAALRSNGIDGVSIAEIMAEAGLTHGGFYAHFKSKDELVGAALGRASRETIDRLSNNRASGDERIDAVIDTYLSAGHAAHPELGLVVCHRRPRPRARPSQRWHTTRPCGGRRPADRVGAAALAGR